MTKSSPELWSISRLAKLFKQDRRDVSASLANVPAAAVVKGHPQWRLEDAAPALARPVPRPCGAGADPAQLPEGFEFLSAIGDPVDAAAAYGPVGLSYQIPALAAVPAVAAGAPCKVAFTLYEAMQIAMPQRVRDIGHDMGIPPWSYDPDPTIWRLDLFDEPNWSHLSKEAGEKVNKAGWERHARKVFAPEKKAA